MSERRSETADGVEVPAAPGGGDVLLRFVVTLDAAPEEYGDTW